MYDVGVSQFLYSINSFLIQLCIFKVADESLITTLSILYSIQIFFFMLMRKLSYEQHLVYAGSIQRPPVIEVWLILAVFTFTLGVYYNWDLTIICLMTIFGFLNTVLDYKLFSNYSKKERKTLIGNLIVFIVLTSNMALFSNIYNTLIWLNLSIALYLIIFCRIELFKVFQLKIRPTIEFYRGFDFILGSGLGYLLPLLILFQLGNQGVVEIRASQLFVSLINFFAMTLFLKNLSKNINSNIYFYSLTPSAILFVIYIILEKYDASSFSILTPVFVHLSSVVYLFIISFVFTQISNYWLSKIIKVKLQNKVFSWHLKSWPIFLTIYFTGMALFGTLGFAISSIIVNALDGMILRRIILQSRK